VALVICMVTLVFLFLNPDYRNGVFGAAAWYLLGLLYFAAYARKRLVRAPEEQFAIERGGAEPETP
jgi:ethanolamine permease